MRPSPCGCRWTRAPCRTGSLRTGTRSRTCGSSHSLAPARATRLTFCSAPRPPASRRSSCCGGSRRASCCPRPTTWRASTASSPRCRARACPCHVSGASAPGAAARLPLLLALAVTLILAPALTLTSHQRARAGRALLRDGVRRGARADGRAVARRRAQGAHGHLDQRGAGARCAALSRLPRGRPREAWQGRWRRVRLAPSCPHH